MLRLDPDGHKTQERTRTIRRVVILLSVVLWCTCDCWEGRQGRASPIPRNGTQEAVIGLSTGYRVYLTPLLRRVAPDEASFRGGGQFLSKRPWLSHVSAAAATFQDEFPCPSPA
jgi:hypothetical protein